MPSPLPSVIALAAERRQILVAALPHLEAGRNQGQTARAVGTCDATLSRLLALGAGSAETPLDRCRAALALPLEALAAAPKERAASDWETLLQTAAVGDELRSLYLSTMRASSEAMTHGRHTGSMALALRRLADHAAMPAWAVERLRAGAKPIALLRSLRRITPELEQIIRGERHFRLHGPTAQRDNTLRLPDGRRCRQLAGYRVVFDDMSVNQPFFTDIVEEGKVVDTILSRQGLYCIDEASWRWLGVELVARQREAYRAEDILRFVRRLMTHIGKFDCLVLEQGVWKARMISGYQKSADGEISEVECERPGMSDEERARLDRGLESIGVHVAYVNYAHGKTIENAFAYLQPVLATHTRDFQNIGAHRGEFERAAKQLARVRAETITPGQGGFAPMSAMADRIEGSMEWINRQPKDALGGRTPDAQWTEDLTLRQLPALADWESAVFFPELRERQIRGCGIHFDRGLTGFPFTFRAGTVMAELGEGYRVAVKFDPADLALGAVILNREPADNPSNRWHYADGQFICRAECETPAPRASVPALPAGHVAVDDYYGMGVGADIGDREFRRAKSFFRTEARLLPRPGQPAVRVSTASDGRGAAVELRGGAIRSPSPGGEGQGEGVPSGASVRATRRSQVAAFRDEIADLLTEPAFRVPHSAFHVPAESAEALL